VAWIPQGAYLRRLEEEIWPGSRWRVPTVGRTGWRPQKPGVPATAVRISGGGDEERLLGVWEGREVLGGDGLGRERGAAVAAAATVSGGTRGRPRRCCGLVWGEYTRAL
jgi:hypothetical protein